MFVNQALNTLRIQSNPLIEKFFSEENVNRIQRLIINNIKDYCIEKQSDKELLVVMQYMYVNHLNTLCGNDSEIIIKLNKLVVHEIVPMIKENIEQYLIYLKDSTSQPVPLERATSTTIKGSSPLIAQEF